LRDPTPCRKDGYYLAVKNNVTGDYDVKFLFGADASKAALALLDTLTGDRSPGRFTVTAIGVTNGDGYLTDVKISECLPSGSAACDSMCTSNTSSGCLGILQQPDIVLSVPPLLVLHVICMLVSWGCLLPLGVLWARNMRWSDKKVGSVPIWFQGHRTLQSVGWLFQLLGFIFIFFHKGGFNGKSHFKTRHEALGLIVVIIGTLQPFNALLRNLPCIGHPPKHGEPRTWGRLLWEIGHRGLGYGAVLLGALNIILGILYASDIGFGGALVPVAITVAALSLGTQFLTGCGAELRRLVASVRTLTRIPAPLMESGDQSKQPVVECGAIGRAE